MITMEKVDYVMNVTGADYSRVREALLATDGEVNEAIAMILNTTGEGTKTEFSGEYKTQEETGKKRSRVDEINDKVNGFGEEIFEAVKEIWEKGEATRLVVMDEHDTVILNVSMTLGAIWTVLAPLASLLGVGVGILSRWEFYVYLHNGEAINVKDYIRKKNRMR